MSTKASATKSNGRVAVITGAAAGIGWATARRLAEDFEHVVIADINAEAAAQRALELGEGHFGIGCDVTSEQDVIRLFETVVGRYGRVDALVNNAGIGGESAMTLEQSVLEFDRCLAVHLRGTFLASREAGRVFVKQQSGAIVSISSIVARGGFPGRNAYGAAKAGISSMTEALACEWARDGIRVNAIAPGYVATELMMSRVAEGALNLQDIERRTPMGRTVKPEAIAEAIAFLVSERADCITGVTLPVDCGWLALSAPPEKLGTVAEKRVPAAG